MLSGVELPVEVGALEKLVRRLPKPPKHSPRFRVELVRGEEARAVLREALLPVYVPRSIYGMVGAPKNVYYRVYRSSAGEYAVFLLYEWEYQVVPPHRYDYEPVIVILDRNLRIKEVYTDGFHYYIHKEVPPPLYQGRPHLRITAPWRSMEVEWREPRDGDVMVYPIDEVRSEFGPRPRYLSDRVLSMLRSREENPLTVSEKLIRNPFSVRKAKHWSTYREPTVDDLVNDLAKNYGLHNLKLAFTKLGILIRTLIDKVVAFLQSLSHRVREVIEEEVMVR